jgi:hypothetical protein
LIISNLRTGQTVSFLCVQINLTILQSYKKLHIGNAWSGNNLSLYYWVKNNITQNVVVTSCNCVKNGNYTKNRYSDSTIQESEPGTGTGTAHNLCKLSHITTAGHSRSTLQVWQKFSGGISSEELLVQLFYIKCSKYT